jgi:hypothetical protein
MNLSKPDKYVSILVEEIIDIVRSATRNLMLERLENSCSWEKSDEKYKECMSKVNNLKDEIVAISQTIGGQNNENNL